MTNQNDEKEQEIEIEEEPSVKQALERILETKEKASTMKKEFKKIHEEAGKRSYEYEKLEDALDGAYKNLVPLSGAKRIDHIERVQSIYGTCASLCYSIDIEFPGLRKFEESMGGWAVVDTIGASGSNILAESTALYEVNASNIGLKAIPPSVESKIDPYVDDQPDVEKELRELLGSIDPELKTHYLGVKEIFDSPHRTRISAASSDMRTLIWEILRRFAPDEQVVTASGFMQIHAEPGVATQKQKVAFILTGTADINGPNAVLIS